MKESGKTFRDEQEIRCGQEWATEPSVVRQEKWGEEEEKPKEKWEEQSDPPLFTHPFLMG